MCNKEERKSADIFSANFLPARRAEGKCAVQLHATSCIMQITSCSVINYD